MQYLSDEEIVRDFEKFLRHESMRAYADYDKVVSLVQKYVNQDTSSKEDTDATAEKLSKAVKLADVMYYAAQQLSTDASHLRKATEAWWQFKNVELNKEK